MSEGRKVECQDCGYRWNSTADKPRCPKAECGRSRNVTPVEDLPDDGQDTADKPDDDADVEESTESDTSTEDEGYTPGFQSVVNRSDYVDDDRPDPPSSSDDEDVDDVEDEDGEQPVPDPDELPELEPEQLEMGIDVMFDMAARRRGPHWGLDDMPDSSKYETEAEALAIAWTPVVNHYAPYLFRQYTEVGIALMCTASIMAPRLAEDRRLAEQEDAEQRDDQASTGSERVRQPVVEEEDSGPSFDVDDREPTDTSNIDIGGYAALS